MKFYSTEKACLYDGKGCLGVQKRLYDGMKKPLWGRYIPACAWCVGQNNSLKRQILRLWDE